MTRGMRRDERDERDAAPGISLFLVCRPPLMLVILFVVLWRPFSSV